MNFFITFFKSCNFLSTTSFIHRDNSEFQKIIFYLLARFFFQNNQKTAINVAHARGVILLSLMKHNVKIFEFTPLQAKSAITGFGKATKEQMILMTQRILNLSEPIKPDDAADACALALTLSLVGKGIDIGSKIKKF